MRSAVQGGGKAALGHRGSFARSRATSAFAASCAAVASLNFLISAGEVLPLPIGSAARFIANAERSAAIALWSATVMSSAKTITRCENEFIGMAIIYQKDARRSERRQMTGLGEA